MSFWFVIISIIAFFAFLISMGLRSVRIQNNSRQLATDALRDAQLTEIDDNFKENQLSNQEVEAMQAEINRAHSRATRRNEDGEFSNGPKGVLIAILVLVFASSAFFYTRLGAPGLPDLPLAQRQEIERPSQERALEILTENGALPPEPILDEQTAALLVQFEAVLNEHSEDPRGWKLLAQTSYNIGNFKRASEAQEKYIELVGSSATSEDYALLAESYILSVNGYISPKAENATRQALLINPSNQVARFYAGMTMKQNGESERALTVLEGILTDGVENPEWREEVERQIAELKPALGPSDEDVANAAQMTDEERQQMIAGMVDGLKNRLANEGGTPDEWARLINTLRTLKRTEEANAILGEARKKFPDSPEIRAIQ